MDVDPLASMRCWIIEVELGGRTFEVPALPAVDWWPVLTTGDLGLILDFITSESDVLDDMLLSGALSHTDLADVLTDVVEEIAGRSFHAAIVLASVAKSQWASVNGDLARSGFRWDEQPLGAALDAVYAVITSRLEGDTLAEFLRLLDNEVLTPGKRRGRSRKKTINDFETVAGPRPTTGVVATSERSGSERPRTQLRLPLHPQGARSVEPRKPRAPRVGSDHQANYVSHGDVGGPASDTVPPLLPAER